MLAYYNNLTKDDKKRLDRIVKQASKITGTVQLPLDTICRDLCLAKFDSVKEDCLHPLNSDIN